MNSKRRFGQLMLVLLAGGLETTACAGTNASAGPPNPVGEYELVSVNGSDVPAEIAMQGVTIRVVSGGFSINADGTCSSRTVLAPPSGAEMTREVSATYTMQGDSLTMNWQGAGTTVGVVDGATFTMDNMGMSFVYSRRR